MTTIEISRRTTRQHRPGQYGLAIDGFDAEYTNDPAQHFPKILNRLIAEGRPVESATTEAHDLASEQSQRVLQRVADRIARGRMLAGGMPTDLNGLAPHLLPKAAKLSASADEAAAAFLNRGRLAGLTNDQRVDRVENRDTKVDHAAEWKANRAALLALRNTELEKLRGELPTASTQWRPKIERRIKSLELEIAGLQIGIVNASHGFQYAYGQYMTGGVNFVSGDIRLVPLMTNTTVDTERDAKDQVSDFTTLDEADGSGYTTGGLALDNQAVNVDDANDRAEADADDETITAFGACTRPLQGVLAILYSASLTASMPLHWLEFASNKTPDGSDFVLQINAEGYVQAS